MCISHAIGGSNALIGVYDRYDRIAERRQAMDTWAREVRRIIGPELKLLSA